MDLTSLEGFALAEDRSAWLDQLIAGTEEHFFVVCLHLQHRGDLEGAAGVIRSWIERYGRTSQVEQMLDRQALLSWETNPDATVLRLRQNAAAVARRGPGQRWSRQRRHGRRQWAVRRE